MRRLAIAVLAVAVLGGCGGSGGSTISQQAAPRLVLRQAELGPEFAQFDGGRQVMADRLPGPRADPRRFDRIDGWKARFKRRGSSETKGPLVVESLLDLFRSAKGAREDYIAYLAQYKTWSGKTVAGLGDQAHAFTSTTGSGRFKVRYFAIAWRERNATASVSANGFDGKIALADVLRLARAQETGMAKAR